MGLPAAVEVLRGNEPALALYRSLGFREKETVTGAESNRQDEQQSQPDLRESAQKPRHIQIMVHFHRYLGCSWLIASRGENRRRGTGPH